MVDTLFSLQRTIVNWGSSHQKNRPSIIFMEIIVKKIDLQIFFMEKIDLQLFSMEISFKNHNESHYRSTRLQVCNKFWTIWSILNYFLSILVQHGLSWSISIAHGPSRAILNYHGPFRTIMGYLGLSHAILGYLRLSRAISSYLRLSRTILCFIWI